MLGLGTFTFALISAGSLDPIASLLMGAIGMVTLVGFVAVESRATLPLVPLALFRSRQFSVANATTFLVYGPIGVFFFLTLLLSARSGQLAQRIGPRAQMTLAPLLCAVGVLLTLGLGERVDSWCDVLPAMLFFGLGLATMVAQLTATALGAAPSTPCPTPASEADAVA